MTASVLPPDSSKRALARACARLSPRRSEHALAPISNLVSWLESKKAQRG